MSLFAVSLGFFLLGGFLSLLAGRGPKLSSRIALSSQMAGCAAGLFSAVQTMVSGRDWTWSRPWSLPLGGWSIGLDSLSAFFLFVIFLLSGLVSVYGAGYVREYFGKKNVGVYFFFFNLLIASMALVAAARDAILFLVSWEVMTLASYFLVVFEHEKEEVRRAGFLYFAAAHAGAACLFLFFLLAADRTGATSFAAFLGLREAPAGFLSVLFLLGVLGFGMKAGWAPFHFWLPEAHPAAPSPVSALMSGAMIKMGIYGLLRFLTFLDGHAPPVAWGLLVTVLGAVSALLGILSALPQKDLKRTLAYSSVENMGIVALGMGAGMLGQALGSDLAAALGYFGVFFHLLSHSLFKGLLFCGAGAVLQKAHTRNVETMGGLLKKMPWTGIGFLAGSLSVCGIPFFTGFIGEWLIYSSFFEAFLTWPLVGKVLAFGAIVALALAGGLAVVCFTRSFGLVFLGEPRSGAVQKAGEVSPAMVFPMAAAALLCLAIGLYPQGAAPLVLPAVSQVLHRPPGETGSFAFWNLSLWSPVAALFGIFLGLVGLLAVVRKILLRFGGTAKALTWDCGYAFPSARMQVTASSFVWPVAALFAFFTGLKRKSGEALRVEAEDAVWSRVCRPVGSWVEEKITAFKRLQQGRLSHYLIYVFLALVFLLVWKVSPWRLV